MTTLNEILRQQVYDKGGPDNNVVPGTNSSCINGMMYNAKLLLYPDYAERKAVEYDTSLLTDLDDVSLMSLWQKSAFRKRDITYETVVKRPYLFVGKLMEDLLMGKTTHPDDTQIYEAARSNDQKAIIRKMCREAQRHTIIMRRSLHDKITDLSNEYLESEKEFNVGGVMATLKGHCRNKANQCNVSLRGVYKGMKVWGEADILRLNDDGTYTIIDMKSHSGFGNEFKKGYRLQLAFYMMLLKLEGYKVRRHAYLLQYNSTELDVSVMTVDTTEAYNELLKPILDRLAALKRNVDDAKVDGKFMKLDKTLKFRINVKSNHVLFQSKNADAADEYVLQGAFYERIQRYLKTIAAKYSMPLYTVQFQLAPT